MFRHVFISVMCMMLYASVSLSQCIPDTSITIPGVYPDSATGLPDGTAGVFYDEVMQVKVLTDTTQNGLPVVITNVVVMSITGLPPGITYQCNPSNCVFPGGSNGCVQYSGIPTVPGSFPMTVNLMVNGTTFGVPISQPQVVDYYSITINQSTGIAFNEGKLDFKLTGSFPNPAVNYTDITFTSPVNGDFTLFIYDILGKEMLHRMVRGKRGQNTIRVDTDDFSPGIYFISLNNGTDAVSRRMTVTSAR